MSGLVVVTFDLSIEYFDSEQVTGRWFINGSGDMVMEMIDCDGRTKWYHEIYLDVVNVNGVVK